MEALKVKIFRKKAKHAPVQKRSARNFILNKNRPLLYVTPNKSAF